MLKDQGIASTRNRVRLGCLAKHIGNIPNMSVRWLAHFRYNIPTTWLGYY